MDPAVPTVLCGDFNTVFDRSLDRAGSSIDDTSRERILALAQLFASPASSMFTWSRWDGSLSSRIDLFGCPYSWISHVSDCNILPCLFSDHCAVRLLVNVPQVVPRGPGRCKLNISFLEDAEYVSLISDFLVDWQHHQNRFSSLAK